MKHTSRACDIVRSFVDRTRNKGEYPEGIEYKVYVLIATYVLGNEKYLISTDLPDGKYYEVAYDADRDAFLSGLLCSHPQRGDRRWHRWLTSDTSL